MGGKLARVGLNSSSIHKFISEDVEDDLHVKTILSLSNATLGVLQSTSLCIHWIGRAYAWASGTDGKHGVKQISDGAKVMTAFTSFGDMGASA